MKLSIVRKLAILAAVWIVVGSRALGQLDAADAPQPDVVVSSPLPAPPVFTQVSPFWVRTEYLLWWSKNGPLHEPIVTLGSSSDAIPGALGQAGTQTILGNSAINYRTLT
ncbi:MAG TPA: hypothetical protein VGJ16_06075, partial [Pirellulales bacterium]